MARERKGFRMMMTTECMPPRVFDFRVVLASGSPRRRELMRMLVPDLVVAESRDVDENYPAGMSVEQVPEWLSRHKAEAYSDCLREGEVLLTADTVVILDGRILGKPADEAEARVMLRRLSGRTHTVVTGVTLSTPSRRISFSESTMVRFDPMTDAEIDLYVDTFRPLDKAGAYGIQEWIGAVGIKGIDGSFYNVMGLPVHAVYTRLVQLQKEIDAGPAE